MTSKTEWEEYFELINNRKPSEAEVNDALHKGEFEVTSPQQGAGTAAVNNQNQEAEFSRRQDTATAGAGEVNRPTQRSMDDFKQHASNFFSWYWERLLKPSQHINDEKPNQAFLWISFAITAVLSAGIFWNVFRRAVDAFATYTRSELNSSMANKVNQLGGQILPSTFFDFLVTFVIIFLAGLVGLAIVTRQKLSFKVLINQYLVWFPTAGLFAAIGFIYSFIASIPKLQSIDNASTFLSNLVTTIGILLLFPVLAIVVNQFAVSFLVQKYQSDNQKLDLIWWQLIQFLITVIVLVIAYDVVIQPMFKSLMSTIGNSISNLASNAFNDTY